MERDEATTRHGEPGEGAGSEPVPAATSGLTAEQLARLRETLVAANSEAVPELIAGDNFDALLASVDPAREAYRRIREQAAREATSGVPRGGGVREPDPALFAELSPEAKIAAGLARSSRQ